MRVSVEDRDSMFFYVVDKDTGKKIDNCLWADDESGEYEVVCLDADGNVITKEKKVGNIRLVSTRNEKGCFTEESFVICKTLMKQNCW